MCRKKSRKKCLEKKILLTAERFHKLNLQRNLKKKNKLDTDQTKRDKLKDKENRQSVREPEEQWEETAYESGVEKKNKEEVQIYEKYARNVYTHNIIFFLSGKTFLFLFLVTANQKMASFRLPW